jgi:hypothetical protein
MVELDLELILARIAIEVIVIEVILMDQDITIEVGITIKEVDLMVGIVIEESIPEVNTIATEDGLKVVVIEVAFLMA